MKPKLFSLVLSLLSDHIQGNTVEKDFQILIKLNFIGGGGPRGVMVKVQDCGIMVSKFEHQLHYYVHFWTNTLGKVMNLLILPAMG